MSYYAVVNPATGETVKEYQTITDDELHDAIARADATFRSWGRTTTAAERAELVRKVGDLHSERRDELAAIIVREMGKPVEQALAEVDFAADIYRYYADVSPKVLEDEPIELLAGEGSAVIRRSGNTSAPMASTSSDAARSAFCSASCRGTSPITRSRASQGRTS